MLNIQILELICFEFMEYKDYHPHLKKKVLIFVLVCLEVYVTKNNFIYYQILVFKLFGTIFAFNHAFFFLHFECINVEFFLIYSKFFAVA